MKPPATPEPERPLPKRGMPPEIEGHYTRLRGVLEHCGSMVVAYSGGVDSGLLAFVANRVLGKRALPVISVSPSLARREKRAALNFLERHGIPHERVYTAEMEDERYRKNNPDRCYFCKNELFARLREFARRRGYACVAHGANLDDLGDYRPGARAADEQRIIAPLVEARMSKAVVRATARALGISLWDKPAAPCLASRIPYFERVTAGKLGQIEESENLLKELGFEVCRVRHHGKTARIEVPAGEHRRLLRGETWARIEAALARIGFERVLLEPDGFRSGRLNRSLDAGQVTGGAGMD